MNRACYFRIRNIIGRIALPITILTAFAPHAGAAWHDQFAGHDVKSHYVHLTGYGGNNTANLKTLWTEYKACADLHKTLGQPFESLSSDDIPPIVQSEDVEIYYSAVRTVTFVKAIRYQIVPTNCALTHFLYQTLDLRSSIGACEMDLIKKEARGVCNSDAHRHASAASTGPKTAPIDMSKVPLNMQAQVQAQIDRMAQLRSKPNSGPPASGIVKDIAGYPCDVFISVTNSQKCIAHPKSDFVIPGARFNLEKGGLLLEVKSPAMTLTAQEVVMNMTVSESLFAVPEDMKIFPVK